VARIAQIKAQIEETTSDYDRESSRSALQNSRAASRFSASGGHRDRGEGAQGSRR